MRPRGGPGQVVTWLRAVGSKRPPRILREVVFAVLFRRPPFRAPTYRMAVTPSTPPWGGVVSGARSETPQRALDPMNAGSCRNLT